MARHDRTRILDAAGTFEHGFYQVAQGAEYAAYKAKDDPGDGAVEEIIVE